VAAARLAFNEEQSDLMTVCGTFATVSFGATAVGKPTVAPRPRAP